uniref:Uncharacterized protein n=1 Tax=Arundo donax TaxID=35708 RepID=A0A0A9HBH9_ARUDO
MHVATKAGILLRVISTNLGNTVTKKPSKEHLDYIVNKYTLHPFLSKDLLPPVVGTCHCEKHTVKRFDL